MSTHSERLLQVHEWSGREVQARLRAGKCVRLLATGSSMWPFVRSGALVELDPDVDLATLEPHMLLAYHQGAQVVLHRLARLEAGNCYFRGDNLGVLEGPVPVSRVLARVHVLSNPSWNVRRPSAAELLRAGRAVAWRLEAFFARLRKRLSRGSR